MGKYFTNEEVAKATLNKLMAMTKKYHSLNVDTKIIPIDSRDYLAFLMIMHPEMNLENMETIVNSELQTLKDDPDATKKMLDRIYDHYDTYDFSKADPNTEEGAWNIVTNIRATQMYGTTMQLHPEYFSNRYAKSLESQMKADKCLFFNVRESTILQNDFEATVGVSINNDLFRQIVMDDEDDIDAQEEAQDKLHDAGQLVFNSASGVMKKYYSGEAPTVDFEMPSEVLELKDTIPQTEAGMNATRIDKYSDDFFKSILEAINPGDSYSAKCHMGYEKKNAIFIDGKNAVDSLPKDITSANYKYAVARLVSEAAHEGKTIDVLNTRVVNGKLMHEVVPVTFHSSKETMNQLVTDYKKAHYNFIRRLFDFGRWKIQLPEGAVKDPLLKNYDENLSKRTARALCIIDYANETLPEKINASHPGCVKETSPDLYSSVNGAEPIKAVADTLLDEMEEQDKLNTAFMEDSPEETKDMERELD